MLLTSIEKMDNTSNKAQQDTNKSIGVSLIIGLFFLVLGIAGFLSRGEPFTINDLVSCLITAGLSFFMLPVFFILALTIIIFPAAGFIFAIIALIFLHSQPIYASGIGITFTSISLFGMVKNNN